MCPLRQPCVTYQVCLCVCAYVCVFFYVYLYCSVFVYGLSICVVWLCVCVWLSDARRHGSYVKVTQLDPEFFYGK